MKKKNNSVNSEMDDKSSESIEEQLDRLSKVLKPEEQESDSEWKAIQSAEEKEEAEELLQAQIQEDQELEKKELDQKAAQEQSPQSADGNLEAVVPEEPPLDLIEVQSCIEALVFISDRAVSLSRMKEILGNAVSTEILEEAIRLMSERYQQIEHGIELIAVSGGYQFRTKPSKATVIQKLARVQVQRLSSGGMETLAIVAYKQPIMKEEIDEIRGVDSSYFIRGLLEKKLIQITGRSELPGRPILYSTTDTFLELFGLADLQALPSLKELEKMIPSSQSANPEDEDPRVKSLRKMVQQMKSDTSTTLEYDPKEDEKILTEIRQKVSSIPTSTPFLDELNANADQK